MSQPSYTENSALTTQTQQQPSAQQTQQFVPQVQPQQNQLQQFAQAQLPPQVQQQTNVYTVPQITISDFYNLREYSQQQAVQLKQQAVQIQQQDKNLGEWRNLCDTQEQQIRFQEQQIQSKDQTIKILSNQLQRSQDALAQIFQLSSKTWSDNNSPQQASLTASPSTFYPNNANTSSQISTSVALSSSSSSSLSTGNNTSFTAPSFNG